MPASLNFYRPADSETRPEYFGAIISGPPHVLHYQVQPGEDGTPNWAFWQVQTLSEAQFWALEHTRAPYELPYLIDQAAFLGLLKTFILPPLPL